MVRWNSALVVYKTFILSKHHHCQSARLFHYPKLEHACLSLQSPPTHLFLYPSPWVTVVSFLNFVGLRALIKVDSCEIFLNIHTIFIFLFPFDFLETRLNSVVQADLKFIMKPGSQTHDSSPASIFQELEL